jgi:hypothetical protein
MRWGIDDFHHRQHDWHRDEHAHDGGEHHVAGNVVPIEVLATSYLCRVP